MAINENYKSRILSLARLPIPPHRPNAPPTPCSQALHVASDGQHYGRIKVGGKLIRESLQTDVWTTAKLRLTDFLKKRSEARRASAAPHFSEAVTLFKQRLDKDTTIKLQSVRAFDWVNRSGFQRRFHCPP